MLVFPRCPMARVFYLEPFLRYSYIPEELQCNTGNLDNLEVGGEAKNFFFVCIKSNISILIFISILTEGETGETHS